MKIPIISLKKHFLGKLILQQLKVSEANLAPPLLISCTKGSTIGFSRVSAREGGLSFEKPCTISQLSY